jgi:hypothetical protein
MSGCLISLVEVTLKEIADLWYFGQFAPVPSSSVDFFILAFHTEELKACGYDPLLFNYKELEKELIGLIGFGWNFPFYMNWVNNDEDSGGYYELQLVNDV